MVDLSGFLAYGSFFLVTVLVNAIAVLGLNVQWGQTGLFNVGVAGFIALGAYVSALATTATGANHWGGLGLPIGVGWALGALAAGLVSAFVGAVTLRLRSDYLAITTFGVAIIIHLAALNLESITGGSFGISFIPRPFESYADRPVVFGLLNLALVAAVVLALYIGLERLARSPFGRVLRALREDERAAASLGKNPLSYRVQAFALGGAIMGLSGAIMAHYVGFIAPDNYLSAVTFQVWAMLIVGGSGNNKGAILGAFIIWGLWSISGMAIGSFVPADLQARAAALRLVAIGLLLSLTLVIRPRGLIGEDLTVSRHLGEDARG